MNFREATIDDIHAMHTVRLSVKENVLSDPSVVTERDYLGYIEHPGRAWICENGEEIIGFAIADLIKGEVWALFVSPAFEKKGVGKRLHNLMLQWYYDQTEKPLMLSTAPRSRAEVFYRMNGWKQVGVKTNGELIFQINKEVFMNSKDAF